MQLTPGKAFSIVFVAFLVVVVVVVVVVAVVVVGRRRTRWTRQTLRGRRPSSRLRRRRRRHRRRRRQSSVVAVVAAVVVAVFVCYGSSYSVTVSAAILQQSVCKELATRECITHTQWKELCEIAAQRSREKPAARIETCHERF